MWILVNSQVVKFMHLDSIESDNEDDIENAMIDQIQNYKQHILVPEPSIHITSIGNDDAVVEEDLSDEEPLSLSYLISSFQAHSYKKEKKRTCFKEK